MAAVDDTENGRNATTLDRIHAAMLLQASDGRRRSVTSSVPNRTGTRLPTAIKRPVRPLPPWREEKRLLDGMLLAVPR